MEEPRSRADLTLHRILIFAMPLLVIWIGDAALSIAVGHPFSLVQEFMPRVIRSVIVGVPFLVLFLMARRRLKAADGPAVAAGLRGSAVLLSAATLMLWGWYTYDALTSKGGFDFGIAIFLMMSPLYMVGLINPGYFIGRWWHERRNPESVVRENTSVFRWILPLLVVSAGILAPVLPRLVVPMISPGEYVDSLSRIFIDDPATGRAYLIWMGLPFLLLALACLSGTGDHALGREVFRMRVSGFGTAAIAGFAVAAYLNFPRTTPEADVVAGLLYPFYVFGAMAGGYLIGASVARLAARRMKST